jgi:hypothetical protein
MEQINVNALYDLGKALQPLRLLPGDPANLDQTHTGQLFVAWWYLDNFLKAKTVSLEVADASAQQVLNAINTLSNKLANNRQIHVWELQAVPTVLQTFETVLAAELQKQLTYIVSQVGGYNMQLLVNKAEVNLQEEALEHLPDMGKKDFREAGRAIAFGLWTAAGIHTMRATESLLRKYHKRVTGRDADLQHLDWGTCIQELKGKAAPKVIQHLDQIRDLHRNPLMHPEEFLDMKEALGLFDIAKSAINALADEIEKLDAAAVLAGEELKKVAAT